MTLRRCALQLATAMLAMSAAILVSSQPGHAVIPNAPVPLEGPSLGAIEAGDKYVFIAGGKRTEGLVVTKLDGTDARTLPAGAGATDIALSRDRRILYAAVPDRGDVVAINTSSLLEIARYATDSCPSTVTVTDRVWFGYACDWRGGIGMIDVTAAKPTVTLDAHGSTEFREAPLLAAAVQENVIVAGELGGWTKLASYRQTPAGTLERTAEDRETGEYLRDLTVTPDGSTVYTANSTGDVRAFGVRDLTPRGILPVDSLTVAVSASPRRGLLAAGSNAWFGADHVSLFRTSDPVPQTPHELSPDIELAERGIAWSPNGRTLYVVSMVDEKPKLHVIKP
jgi:DNA-binding beta-propeller fold protein YncE